MAHLINCLIHFIYQAGCSQFVSNAKPDSVCENQSRGPRVKLPCQKGGRRVRSTEISLLKAWGKTQGSEISSSLLAVNIQEQQLPIWLICIICSWPVVTLYWSVTMPTEQTL